MNTLYYGDNLAILQQYIPDGSVDLVYLDPPFKSQTTYNILFDEPTGEMSEAQISAFEDTWHWGIEAERAFEVIMETAPARVVEFMRACRDNFIGRTDVTAYLTMMCIRLLRLHRALKPTGSIYLHCDPTASHYLKLLMDAIFGRENFRNEIVWHYKFRMMYSERIFNRKHDILLFYGKSDSAKLRMAAVVEPWTREEIIKTRKQAIYRERDGREWIWMPGPKGRSKNKKKYLDEIIAEGKALDDVWDIPVITSSAKERLGYPTQKPEPLLERIIKASSDEGDLVLDPFCGCGTAVAVAEHLYIASYIIAHSLRNWKFG